MKPTLIVVSALLAILNMYVFKQPLVGSIAVLLYFGLLGYEIGTRMMPKQSKKTSLFFGSFALILIQIILNTAAYYAFGTTPMTISITLLLPLGVLFFTLPKHETLALSKSLLWDILNTTRKSAQFLPAIIAALDVGMICFLYSRRTFDVMPSPWQAVGPAFFLVLFGTTALLLYALPRIHGTTQKIMLSSLHLFVVYAVTSILYPLGFGFDGFIHRTTEMWIFEYGQIAPLQPFYIGQYSFVVWLARLTQLPIFYIDVYLVPMLAAITLPSVIGYTLTRVFRISMARALQLLWLLPFVFFLSLHLTTPYNMVLLLHILGVFFALGYTRGYTPAALPILVGADALTTHPLVGLPLALFLAATMLIQKQQHSGTKKTTLILFFLATVLVVPAMFITHLVLNGLPFPELTNPIEKLPEFLSLLQRPYWYAASAPIRFQLLYAWQWMIVPVFLALAWCGWHVFRKKMPIICADLLFPLGFFGFILGAWLLRSWIIFPNVANFEQGGYPTRLLITSLIFLLPFGMLGIKTLFQKLSSIRPWRTPAYRTGRRLGRVPYIVIPFLITLSIYFAYPQYNQKVYFPGYNVSRADFEAAKWIHNANDDVNYIVLANSLTSVAALTKYSFLKHFQTENGEVFYYSIPTGGSLYQLYERMIYEGQKREYMEEALALTGAKKSYFVVSSFWKNFSSIVEGAKKTADSWQEIGDGKIVIFEYKK